MAMPRRLLLVGATTGYQTRMFTEAARRLDCNIILATDRCHVMEDPWGDQAIAVRFEEPERSAAELAERAGQIDGILALGDRPAYLAALAAQHLGVPFHSPTGAKAAKDKFAAHECFRGAGLATAAYTRVPLAADPQAVAAAYPCVLKPLGLSASRGVIRANGPEEFVAAFQRIRKLLAGPEIVQRHEDQDRYLQVEEYISGREFALEGVMTHGELQTLALFDKPDPLEGPYFEETIYVTPSREPQEAQRRWRETTARAAAALGLVHGPVHAEFRWDGQRTWMLEVAARPIGGLCAGALRFDDGMSLEELLLRHAAGEQVSHIMRERESSGVMMIPIPRGGVYQGVNQIENARAVPGITGVEITAKQGQRLVPLPEGASYLGFLFARANDPAAVEAALREAQRTLQFDIVTELRVW